MKPIKKIAVAYPHSDSHRAGSVRGGDEAVRQGAVERVDVDGNIHVRDSIDARQTVACLHLRASKSSPPEYRVGDAVLYVIPEGAQTGCVLGIVEPYRAPQDRLSGLLQQTGKQPSTTTVEDDVVRIKASKGLVIECGQGTIIITQDGKIQIKGTEVLSRARGMNKIKGAGVDIN
jgi:hypothetical protein